MFRLQNNVPEVYVQQSRDFQLFCRLYDSVLGGVRYSIDSLSRTANTKECNDRMLELLKLKLGLFTELELSNKELRYVLEALPIIMRYKGCIKGLEYVLNLFQRISQIGSEAPTLTIKDYNIDITFSESVFNDKLLFELLQYIIPTGYSVKYQISKHSANKTEIVLSNKVTVHKVTTDGETGLASNIRKVDDDTKDELKDSAGAVGLTTVTTVDQEIN